MKKLILLSLFFSSCLMAKERITAGIILFPPNAMLDEVTSKCVGQGVEITQRILAGDGIEVSIICAPPSRIYQLVREGIVDLTINIKQTASLPDHVIFIDTPYRVISLNMYSHKDAILERDVAAVKGFNYQGQRVALTQQGYELLDMPTSISAIQVFLKKQSGHLLSYSSSVDYYVNKKKLDIKNQVSAKFILDMSSHYAISGISEHKRLLQNSFNDYAQKHKVSYFTQIDMD